LTGIAIPSIVTPKIVLAIGIILTPLEILNLNLLMGHLDGTLKLMETGPHGHKITMETTQNKVKMVIIFTTIGVWLMEAMEVGAVMVLETQTHITLMVKEIGKLVLRTMITHGYLVVMLKVILKNHGQMLQVTGLKENTMLMEHGLMQVPMLHMTIHILALEIKMEPLMMVLKAAILGQK